MKRFYFQLLLLLIFHHCIGATLTSSVKVALPIKTEVDSSSDTGLNFNKVDANTPPPGELNDEQSIESIESHIAMGKIHLGKEKAIALLKTVDPETEIDKYQEILRVLGLITKQMGGGSCLDCLIDQSDASYPATLTESGALQDVVDARNREVGLLDDTKTIKKQRALIFSIIIAFVIVLGVIWLVLSRSKLQNRMQKMKTAQMVNELERNRKSLYLQTLHMIRMNNGITDLESQLNEIKPRMNGSSFELQKVINTLKINKGLEKEWDNFNYFFKNIHSEFVEYMRGQYPDLTLGELRLCALLKLNLSNAEIASIMNIETKSVRMSKYRLKKKLTLPHNKEVSDFIHEIEIVPIA